MAAKTSTDIEKSEFRAQSVENGNFETGWRSEKWGDNPLDVAAQDTVRDEKSMTTWEAVRASKKAILWCLVICTCVIMEGYDLK